MTTAESPVPRTLREAPVRRATEAGEPWERVRPFYRSFHAIFYGGTHDDPKDGFKKTQSRGIEMRGWNVVATARDRVFRRAWKLLSPGRYMRFGAPVSLMSASSDPASLPIFGWGAGEAMARVVHLQPAMESDLAKRVAAAFEHDSRINLHRHPIRITVEEDAVVLEGEVENVAVKKTALEIAAATPGVRGVVDRLRIARIDGMTDAEIRDHLRDAFLQEPAFRDVTLVVQSPGRRESVRKARGEPYAFIDADTEDGVVTLNGQLPSLSHKRLAGVLAWWIPGTRDVVNGIEVVPDQVDNDDEITDAVRLVLEKDRLVDETEIRAHTRNRIVTLEGLVPNDRVREMAELDAWIVFGVDGVVNRLEVRAGSSP